MTPSTADERDPLQLPWRPRRGQADVGRHRRARERGAGGAAAGLALALFLSACGAVRDTARPAPDPAAANGTAPQGADTAAVPPAGNEPGDGLHGVAFNPPLPAPDFTLADARGGTFRLSAQRGNAVLLFFGYTTCPDVCPTTLADLRRVRGLLGEDADRVRVAFVTVDPERDSPRRLGDYLRSAGHESFIGLTGPRRDLERVWQDYRVHVQREEAPGSAVGYWVTHTAAIYLIGPDGRLLTRYAFGTAPEEIAADLRRILPDSNEVVQP